MAIVYSIIFISFISCVILTPIVIKFAVKHGFVDIPKDSRRVHSKPMPRIGGIAIVTSVFIGLMVYFLVTKNIPSIALNEKAYGFVIGGLIIFSMGLIDDIFNLRARYKFIFQLVAALTIYSFGIRIGDMKIPFLYTNTIDLGSNALPTIIDLLAGICNFTEFLGSFLNISFPISMVWIIGLTNAINLIDGLDGLAAGISAISATALLIIFIATSASLEAIIITAVLVGATLGFLPYNFNPAKTFMGDCSSNFLGFTLAVVSILGFAKGYTIIAILAPILALGVPIFDTMFAMIRRFLKGQPMLKPDGAHIHHRLIKMGLTQRQAVIILYTITSALCVLSVTIVSADFFKLILFLCATICFLSIGIISIKRSKENPNENLQEINKNFSMEMEHEIEISQENVKK